MECVAAQIVEPALNRGGQAAGQCFFFHAALFYGREIIAGGPDAGGIFLVIGDGAVFKSLKGHLPLTEIFIADGVKIILTHINRQILAPIIRNTLKFNGAALLETGEPVSAGAERGLQRRGLKITAGPIIGGENGHSGHGQMQVTAAVGRKRDLHHILSFGLGAGHFIESFAVKRMPFGFENIERKGHIAGGEPGAIMKPRLGTQQKAIGQLVIRHAHGARHQPIKRVRLIR